MYWNVLSGRAGCGIRIDCVGFQDHGRFSDSKRSVFGASVEDQVIAAASTHVLIGLFAHDPEECVHDIGFSASIRSDDPRDPMVEVNDSFVLKGLKALNLKPFDSHLGVYCTKEIKKGNMLGQKK